MKKITLLMLTLLIVPFICSAAPKKASKKEGLIKKHYSTGEVRSESNYAKGRKNGKSISYYQSGQIRSSGLILLGQETISCK